MSDELLGCPFCGEKPAIRENKHWLTHASQYLIECENVRCLAYSQTRYWCESREGAIATWNMRKCTIPSTKEVDGDHNL